MPTTAQARSKHRQRGAASVGLASFALASAFAIFGGERIARAEEPVAASEPRLMSETAEVTSVVDAFDKDDPFDLHLSLGFSQMWKSANIRRETALFQPGLTTGNFVSKNENVATVSQTLSVLNIGADLGIYRDLALVLRLPLILADTRELGDLDGSTRNPQRLADPTGAPLFSVPFKSPSRSGIDYFSFGLDWALVNQQRDRTKPTWVIGAEGRIGVGTPLHACNAGASVQCPDPASGLARDPGVSRAMTSFGFHTVISKRFGYVEPYSGLWFLAEFAQDRGDFGATNSLKGSLVNHPPILGSFVVGIEVIPYEQRETFQRFIADFRFRSTYNSPGREYSELFDALGSSQTPSLRNPNPSGYQAGPNGTSVVDPASQKVFFTGITDQQAYGSVAMSASATWQAGEYIKFQLGGGFQFNQSHLITGADACNPDFKSDPNASGPCRGVASGGVAPITGIPNPNHRAVIDLPGRRFSVDDTVIYNLWLTGILMF